MGCTAGRAPGRHAREPLLRPHDSGRDHLDRRRGDVHVRDHDRPAGLPRRPAHPQLAFPLGRGRRGRDDIRRVERLREAQELHGTTSSSSPRPTAASGRSRAACRRAARRGASRTSPRGRGGPRPGPATSGSCTTSCRRVRAASARRTSGRATGGATWGKPQRLDSRPMKPSWLARTTLGLMLGDYISQLVRQREAACRSSRWRRRRSGKQSARGHVRDRSRDRLTTISL